MADDSSVGPYESFKWTGEDRVLAPVRLPRTKLGRSRVQWLGLAALNKEAAEQIVKHGEMASAGKLKSANWGGSNPLRRYAHRGRTSRSKLTPSEVKRPIMSAGSVGTFCSKITLPASSTTHTDVAFTDTSSPTKCAISSLLPRCSRQRQPRSKHRHRTGCALIIQAEPQPPRYTIYRFS